MAYLCAAQGPASRISHPARGPRTGSGVGFGHAAAGPERVRFALAHLITRTVYAPSEWRSIRIIQENSAVADILGIDRDSVKKHDVYAVAPAFYQLKDKLDSYLTDKTDSLFGLTNRQLKTDLNLRPIYHQKDETSDAHLYMGLLSYWIVNTIRYQLKEKGEKS